MLLAGGAWLAGAGSICHADTRNWTGLGLDDNWTDGLNWDGGSPPASGDSLVFDISPRLTPFNDFNAGTFTAAGITFTNNAAAYTLSGARLILGTDASAFAVTNNSGVTQTLALPVLYTPPVVGASPAELPTAGVLQGNAGVTFGGDFTNDSNNYFPVLKDDAGNTIDPGIDHNTLVTNLGDLLTFSGNVYLTNSVAAYPNGVPNTFGLNINGNGAVNISGNIANASVAGGPAGRLIINTTGNTTLGGSNSFTGGLQVTNNGSTAVGPTLTITNPNALGAGTVDLRGIALQANTGADWTINNNVSISGTLTVNSDNAITINGDFTNSGGSRTLVNNLPAGKALTLGNLFIAEASKGGGRTFTLTGTGDTVIDGSLANAAGPTTNFQGGAVQIFSTGMTTLNGDNKLGYFSNSSNDGKLQLDVGTGTVVINGTNTIQGTVGATKYTTTIQSGYIQIGSDNPFGVVSGFSGATLNINSSGVASTHDIFLQSVGGAHTIPNVTTLNGSNLTVSGDHSLTFSGSFIRSGSSDRTLTNNLVAGSGNVLTFSGPVYLSDSAGTGHSLTIAGTGDTTISGGISNFNGTATQSSSITFSSTGATTLSGSNSYTGGTTVSAGAVTTTTNFSNGTLTVSGGTAVVAQQASNNSAAHVTVVPSVSVSGGSVNLNNNALVVEYGADASPVGSIRSALQTGFAGGAWNGPGIASGSAASHAAGPAKTAIGYTDTAAFGAGLAGSDATAVVLYYTLSGDANLDGKVNALDFNAVASNFGTNAGNDVWTAGDFNYDGSVTTDDFVMLSGNFNQTLPAPGPALNALVPEPGAIVFLAALLGLGSRRRRGAR